MKKLLSLFLALVICIAELPAIAEENAVKLYVSCDGNDENPGSYEQPLKTLEGAKNAVGAVNTGKPVEVIFREGEYYFTDGVDFTEQDSGNENAPITYKAEDGERVVFKGSFAFDANKGKTVTDEEILKRVDLPVRNRLVQFDLKELGYEYGLPNTNKIQQFLFLMYPSEAEYVNLFLDDKEQMISQWPNGDDEYVSWIESIEKGSSINAGTKGGTFRYDGTRPSRWSKADSFWIGGYPGYNYRYERNSVKSVDVEKQRITLATPTCFGLISSESKSWKAFNLLEEIDIPGEWYIDKNTMILYYYPPYSLENKKLELAFVDKPFFNMNKVNNVNIEGIEFTQHRGGAAVKLTSCSHINITGCTFKNLEGRGVLTEGVLRTHFNYSRWKDGGYEIHIRDSVFDNIGSSAIQLEAGDIDTLSPGNSSIENNIFMRISTKMKNAEGLILNGVGNTVMHNNMSSGSFHAITYRGSMHKINNNEFYDVNKCTDDAGAVYAGRDYTLRGTEIAYNYIHDNIPYRQKTRGYNIGVYWDDSLPGQTAHHNILVNGLCPFFASGQDDHIENNTLVNFSTYGILIRKRSRGTGDQTDVNNLENRALYFEKFPLMEIGLLPQFANTPWMSTSVGNLEVNVTDDDYAEECAKIDNVKVDTCNDFVDPEHQDYRIKLGSETAKLLPELLNENYNLDNIGIQGRSYTFNEETASFEKLYPQNGDGSIKAEGTEFVWERVFGANSYRLVIARDKELTDIVYDEIEPYNIAVVEGLEKDKVYYWQVWARNTSRKYSNEWKSNSEPYELVTSKYIDAQLTELENALRDSKARYLISKESDKPGDYKPGALLDMKNMLSVGNILLKLRFGKNITEEINTLARRINDFWDNDNLINVGYVDMVQTAPKQSDWLPKTAITVDEGKKFTVKGAGETFAYAEKFKNITKQCIISFRTRIKTQNWVGFGMSAEGLAPYAQGNPGYFIVIKDGVIEFQKNAGSGSSIIDTKDIKIVNDDLYHDIDFGVITLKACRLYVVCIDGEVVFNYVDASPVNNKLMPLFHATHNSTFEVVPRPTVSDEEEYAKFIVGTDEREAEVIYEKYGTDGGLLIIKQGVDTVISNGELVKTDENGLAFYDNEYYITKDEASKLIGELKYDDIAAKQINSIEMYSLSELARTNGYSFQYDTETELYFVTKGLKDELRNMVSLLNVTEKFLSNI